jgi:hypothetical protein
MKNHTNTDPDGNDVRYDDPSILFVGLILLMSFCSISFTFYQICYGSNSICGDIKNCYKRGCPYLYENDEFIEYEIDYESDNDEVTKPIQEIGIKKIPTFSNVNHYPIYCSICQEEQTNTVKVDCGHNFCKECIMGYMKVGRECPNCRESISSIYEIEVLVFK